jgi:hypothetical protein
MNETDREDLYRQVVDLLKENKMLLNDVTETLSQCDEHQEVILQLQLLCGRASESLDFWLHGMGATENDYLEQARLDEGLIIELREAVKK